MEGPKQWKRAKLIWLSLRHRFSNEELETMEGGIITKLHQWQSNVQLPFRQEEPKSDP